MTTEVEFVQQWLPLARMQDRAAWDQIVLAVRPQMLHWAAGYGALDVEADVQEALLKAFQALPNHELMESEAFDAWLRTILRNSCIDRQRRQRRERPLATATEDSDAAGDLQDTGSTPAQSVRRTEEESRLKKLVSTLPPDYQRVLELRFVQNMPYDQIAAEMGKSCGAVAGLLARALKELQKKTSRSSWSRLI